MTTKAGDAVLLLGGAGGIGAAVARRLVAHGRPVHLAGRTPGRLEALADELDGNVTWSVVDARDVDAVLRCAKEAADLHGGLTAIGNCVGSILLAPAHRTSLEQWNTTLAQNLTTAFAAVRAAARVLRGGGSVLLFSTAAARTGLANHEAIAAAKAGVIGLARSAAATYARRGLRVNVVAPGLVRTPLAAPLTSVPAIEQASAALHALGRIGEPEDVAGICAWLLGEDSAWVTGQVFGVDGGLAAVRPTGS